MPPRAKIPSSSVVLEVSPRVAKLMVATCSPLMQIQRASAAVLSEQTDDPVAALRALLVQQPIGARQAGLLFGRESFSLRTLELPSTDPKEIASMLELQLGKLTPYPRSEILSGWTAIGSFREGYTSVLLAVARKLLIDSVLQFLKSKGVEVLWVGLSTEGLARWWALSAEEDQAKSASKLSAVIDIDGASTDCAILSEGRLLFTQSITIGYDQLSSSEQATLRWLSELVRLPRILLHEEIKGQIGRGVITGMTQGLQSVVEQLNSQWGVGVESIDALARWKLSTALGKTIAASKVSYAALAGMISSGKPPQVDLIPPESRVSQALQVRSRHLSRFAGSLAIALFLAAVFYMERVTILKSYLSQLKAQAAKFEEPSKEIRQRRQTMWKIRDWLDPSKSVLSVLHDVASAADSTIALTQLSYLEDQPTRFKGKAESVQGPYEFVDRLKKQPSWINSACYVASAKGVGERGAEFEVICGKGGT